MARSGGGPAVICEWLDYERAPWDEMDSFPDRTVFQTKPWLEYLKESQGAIPVILALRRDSAVAGYFTGAMVRKFGIRILGSPFPGWATPYMGFNVTPGMTRTEAIAAVERFAFHELGCRHIELADPAFDPSDGAALDFRQGYYTSYWSDLSKSEQDLFAGMESACRRCIRKAEKEGVTVEQARDAAFADEYYEQLKDVFAKQRLTPTYGIDRVRRLIGNVLPSGNLLLLRARNRDGVCIGTGIYPGFNQRAMFWGNASWRAHQNLRPNEALHWYAMRYWKSRGVRVFDWGGATAGDRSGYKEKYGVAPLAAAWFTKSRPKVLAAMRDSVRGLYYRRRNLVAALRGALNSARKTS